MQHPLSLLSIFLLLVNDHILKMLFPSWITGKLSDLMGLFFFPFIITGFLSVILPRLRHQPSVIGFLGFSSVIAWFILFKTFFTEF